MTTKFKQVFLTPLISENPVTYQILGVCSALAVTSSLKPALLMSVAMTSVITFAAGAVSAIRHTVPKNIRIIIEITIVSSLVIIVDQILKAYAYEVSRQLSVFVGLIITNCIVLARCEGFAMHNPVGISMLDGLAHGIGYSLLLLSVATIRELLGSGNLLGVNILHLASDGGWYQPNGLMRLAPSGFFIIGLLIWLINHIKQRQLRQTSRQLQNQLLENRVR
jgi:Na+-transporting NADH:ubiquinone oxidoreductase subunit D